MRHTWHSRIVPTRERGSVGIGHTLNQSTPGMTPSKRSTAWRSRLVLTDRSAASNVHPPTNMENRRTVSARPHSRDRDSNDGFAERLCRSGKSSAPPVSSCRRLLQPIRMRWATVPCVRAAARLNRHGSHPARTNFLTRLHGSNCKIRPDG